MLDHEGTYVMFVYVWSNVKLNGQQQQQEMGELGEYVHCTGKHHFLPDHDAHLITQFVKQFLLWITNTER